MEQKLFPDWRGLALLGAGLTYLLLTPGACALCIADCTPWCKVLVITWTSLQWALDFLAMFATGVIQGAIDYYVSAPLQRNRIKAFGKVGGSAGASA
jgi:hypothetical protein